MNNSELSKPPIIKIQTSEELFKPEEYYITTIRISPALSFKPLNSSKDNNTSTLPICAAATMKDTFDSNSMHILK